MAEPDQRESLDSGATREPSAAPIPPSRVATSEQIQAAQNGDLIAMSDLVDTVMPWVGRLCGSIALDAGPDAAQETLIQVMRDLKGLRDPASFRSWVRRIATREAIRHATRARREPPILDIERIEDNRGAVLDPGLRHDVAIVLADLSADQRAILVLRDLEGLSESEAAALLNVAKGTIKSRLHRAREAFRKRWPT
jgi:RNA polymerase sigma factor (sigma-70 family)